MHLVVRRKQLENPMWQWKKNLQWIERDYVGDVDVVTGGIDGADVWVVMIVLIVVVVVVPETVVCFVMMESHDRKRH